MITLITSKRTPPRRGTFSHRLKRLAAPWPAFFFALLLTACEPPAPPTAVDPPVTGDPPVIVKPPTVPPTVRLTFRDAAVRKSKMLVSTNRNADGTYKPQSFTNTLLNNGSPAAPGAVYSITEKPAGLTDQITVNSATGEVTFGEAALTKVNADGPQTVTIQAAYKGKTKSYTFTVTDHFSPRDLHASVVIGNKDIYVIGGVTQKFAAATFIGGSFTPQISSDEVWRSSDGGRTWDQAAGSMRFTERGNHEAVVLNGALYVIAGAYGSAGVTGRDDVWRSTDRGVSWSRVTPAGGSVEFPMDYSFASAMLGNAMYVMGGIQRTPAFTRLDQVWKSTNQGITWTQATNSTDPKFPARSQHAAVVLGSAGAAKLYVIGGAGAGGLDDVWESSDGTSWNHVNISAASRDKFPARRAHSAAAVGDTVYVIAGDQGGTERRDVWTSGDKGEAWTPAAANADFPARRNHSSAALDGALYVIGGSAISTQLFNDVWKSTDGGQTWVNVHKNP